MKQTGSLSRNYLFSMVFCTRFSIMKPPCLSVFKMKHIVSGIFLLSSLLLLSSCLGLNAEIVLNPNGSGSITLEYLISKALDSLGKLDGNERWNTIPVGKADFERTLDRLPEMKLSSFSSKEDGKNLQIAVKMEFSSIRGLLAFLDASGRRSSFSGDARSGRLTLNLSEGMKNKNPDLDKLIAGISEGYSFRISMSFPGEGSFIVTDNQGRALTAISGSDIHSSGKKVFCSFPLYEVLSSGDGINVEFSWE